MKKSVAKAWVKALRSGKYKQTTNVLMDHKGYCCLGILCKVSKVHEPIGFLLPDSVVQSSGMKSNDGYTEHHH